ncbi:MAG: sugar phosphate isomerase/epimerase, partial [Verrucomicrobiota bacterium]
PQEKDSFLKALNDTGTPWIAEVNTCTTPGVYVPNPGHSVAEHLASLEEGVLHSMEGSPLFINTMAGSDAWDTDEALRFHEGLVSLQEKEGITISVELHRGRYSHNPWLMARMMRELPDLKITCDFSHWCVVAERLVLDDEPEILALSAEHAHHIQPRVGYDQGPQVPDPRAPEHAEDLAAHERWWDVVWDSMISRGYKEFTLTPEFGPDGYLHCAPFTQEPVADLWDINTWIGHRQRDRLRQRLSPSEK